MIGKPANLLVRVRPKYQIRIKIHLGRDAAHRQHTRLIAHVTLYEARDGEDAAPVVRDELANETTVLPYHLALNAQRLKQLKIRVEAPFRLKQRASRHVVREINPTAFQAKHSHRVCPMNNEALIESADAHCLHARTHRRWAYRNGKINFPFLNGMPKIRATAIDKLNGNARTSFLIRIQPRYDLRV